MMQTGLRNSDQIYLNGILRQQPQQNSDSSSSSDENEDYQRVPNLPTPPSSSLSSPLKIVKMKEEQNFQSAPAVTVPKNWQQLHQNPAIMRVDRGQESLTFFSASQVPTQEPSSSSSGTVQKDPQVKLRESDYLNSNCNHDDILPPITIPPPTPMVSSEKEKKITSSQTSDDPMSTEEAALLLTSLGGREHSKIEGSTRIEMSAKMEVDVCATAPATTTVVAARARVGKQDPLSGVKLPMNTMNEFERLESIISENETLRLRLLKRLGTIGGKNFGQCARNGLKALLTDSLATQFNWAGRGEKMPFQSSEIKSVLFDAVRLNFPKVTDYQLKDPVQCWLKRSRKLEDVKELKSKKLDKILSITTSSDIVHP